MDNLGNGDENLEISQMDSAQKRDLLKALTTGRDPKSGKFLPRHSGNPKGRPRCATTLDNCLNISFSRKATVKIEGKMVSMTNLQLACDMIIQDTLSKRDIKGLIQLLNAFGSKIDISSELPTSKIGSGKKDPYYDESVEKIKKAIYNELDKRNGTYRGTDNENPSDS